MGNLAGALLELRRDHRRHRGSDEDDADFRQLPVHPGSNHGFSHDGPAYDPEACRAGLEAVGELLGR